MSCLEIGDDMYMYGPAFTSLCPLEYQFVINDCSTSKCRIIFRFRLRSMGAHSPANDVYWPSFSVRFLSPGLHHLTIAADNIQQQ